MKQTPSTVDTANELSTNPLEGLHGLCIGYPEGERIYKVTYDTSKEERILGIKFRTMSETTRDTLEDIARRGW